MRLSNATALGAIALFLTACAQTDDGAAFDPVIPREAGPEGVSRDGGEGRGSSDATTEAADTASGQDAADAPATRDGGGDAGTARDAAADASSDATRPEDARAEASGPTPSDAGCTTATLAVVAANATSAAASTWTNGTWSTAVPLVGSAKSRPAVVARGAAFAAVLVASDDLLYETTRVGAAWSPLARVGAGLAALDEPRLVSTGGSLHLVHQQKGGDADSRYFYTGSTGTVWGAPEPIGAGADISFGPRAPGVTASGTGVLIAHAGGNGALFARERSSAWGASTQVGSIATRNDLPVAATELTGGAVLVVYSSGAGAAQRLKYVTRTGTTWSASDNVYDDGANLAYSNDPLALLPLASGRAVLVFRGGNANLYMTRYDPAAAARWSAPTPLTASPVSTASAPSIAAGVCGADAVVAFVEGSGLSAVTKVARLTGTAWSAPEAVPGLIGAAFVGLASRP